MKIFLLVLSILALSTGIGFSTLTETVIGDLEGFGLYIISAFFCAARLLLEQLTKQQIN